ncbi:MAG: 50S ribosomal protein L29 [Bacilli bacterium]|nr:50S ribosomal protein L29 [Bacilli bacterium]
MTVKELRELSIKELDERIAELHQKQFDLSRKAAVGTLETPTELRVVRKDIARAETVKREKELQINK